MAELRVPTWQEFVRREDPPWERDHIVDVAGRSVEKALRNFAMP